MIKFCGVELHFDSPTGYDSFVPIVSKDSLVKPNTCGSCRHFEPPPGEDWKYIQTRDVSDRRDTGWCRNSDACIGAVLLTSRDSWCKWFEPTTPEVKP